MDVSEQLDANCAGQLYDITPDFELFSKCSSSSAYLKYDCNAGLQGKHIDSQNAMWVTDEENTGAYLEFSLKEFFFILKGDADRQLGVQEQGQHA